MTEETGAETPPKPKRAKPKMVNVINTHRFRSFHMGGGTKISPGMQARIPSALYDKVKDNLTWLKRAERGDVI